LASGSMLHAPSSQRETHQPANPAAERLRSTGARAGSDASAHPIMHRRRPLTAPGIPRRTDARGAGAKGFRPPPTDAAGERMPEEGGPRASALIRALPLADGSSFRALPAISARCRPRTENARSSRFQAFEGESVAVLLAEEVHPRHAGEGAAHGALAGWRRGDDARRGAELLADVVDGGGRGTRGRVGTVTRRDRTSRLRRGRCCSCCQRAPARRRIFPGRSPA